MLNNHIENDISGFEKIKQLVGLAWRHAFFCYILFIFDSWVLKKKYAKNPKTLLLVRMDSIGDYMLFRNFLESVRSSKKYKDYSITLCGNALWKDIAEKFDSRFVDNFIWIQKEKFITDMKYRSKMLADIQGRGFSVVIQPTYSREFLVGDAIVRATDAAEKIGSVGYLSNMTRHQKIISDRYYTHLIPAASGTMFEFFRNKEFFQALFKEETLVLKQLAISNVAKDAKKEKYVVFMPGAGSSFRRWKPENFASLATYLKQKYATAIVVGGGANDENIARQIADMAGKEFVKNVAGKIGLVEFISLVANAVLLVANETSAIHISASVGVPAVCISNGNHFGRFNPYPSSLAKKISYAYPPEIQKHIDDHLYLCNKYGNSSELDINAVSVDDVKTIIDFTMQQLEPERETA